MSKFRTPWSLQQSHALVNFMLNGKILSVPGAFVQFNTHAQIAKIMGPTCRSHEPFYQGVLRTFNRELVTIHAVIMLQKFITTDVWLHRTHFLYMFSKMLLRMLLETIYWKSALLAPAITRPSLSTDSSQMHTEPLFNIVTVLRWIGIPWMKINGNETVLSLKWESMKLLSAMDSFSKRLGL